MAESTIARLLPSDAERTRFGQFLHAWGLDDKSQFGMACVYPYMATYRDIQSLVEFEKQGRVKLLAYTGKQRHPLIPHVPTANEANVGLSDYELTFWVAMIAPSSTPADA